MIDTLITVVLLSLAVFGVAFTIVFLDGPWDIISKIRRRLTLDLESVYDDDGNQVDIIEVPKEGFLKVLTCFWCTSFWITIIIVGTFSTMTGFSLLMTCLLVMSSYGLNGLLYEMIANG